MHFSHAPAIWRDFPGLVPGVLFAQGITATASVNPQLAHYNAIATARLAQASEGDLPEVQAWRRAFSTMGFKPTQYRCASESLLRRFRKEGALPHLHPLVDLCNAMSLAFAIPIAVFDVAELTGSLQVRYASGSESYLAFSGDTEAPEPGEVIFADEAMSPHAHARRWTHRQSKRSAVSHGTASVLVVAEALHANAAEDVTRLVTALAQELQAVWGAQVVQGVLTPAAPRFDFQF